MLMLQFGLLARISFPEAIHMDGFHIEIETSPLKKLKFKPALVTAVTLFCPCFLTFIELEGTEVYSQTWTFL